MHKPSTKAGAGVSTNATRSRTSWSITPQRTHDHTHKHRSTPQPPSQQDAHTSSRPQKARAEQPRHSTFCRANEPREWACEKRNGPKPTTRAHARIATPLTQPAWAERRHRAKGGAPWVLLSAIPFQRSHRFRQSASDAKGISHGNGFAIRKAFTSNTALAHPRGVAVLMFLVLCDLPPSPAACGAYRQVPPVRLRAQTTCTDSTGLLGGTINPGPCQMHVFFR